VSDTAAQQQDWTWGFTDFLRWKALPGWLGGDPDLLRNYKDAWVTAHRQEIKRQSGAYYFPPELLAGVAWIEVGGDPDFIDNVAYRVRAFVQSSERALGPLTFARKPELTSMGDVSIQMRRAAETLGFTASNLNSRQWAEIARLLADEPTNLLIVARHLHQLKQVDFPNVATIGDYEIRIIGSRYNRGPDLSLAEIEQNTSYGDFIVQRRQKFRDLLKD